MCSLAKSSSGCQCWLWSVGHVDLGLDFVVIKVDQRSEVLIMLSNKCNNEESGGKVGCSQLGRWWLQEEECVWVISALYLMGFNISSPTHEICSTHSSDS